MKTGLTSIARALRSNATETEKYLWYTLRFKNLGVKFRRQEVIGSYIVDFVCFERKLIIEIDGGQHMDSQNDMVRDEWLKKQGYKVLRFWNNDVLGNRDGVMVEIAKNLETPSLPLPARGREIGSGHVEEL